MKKVVLSAAVVAVFAIGANAQTFSKGDLFLNANISGLKLTHAFTDDIGMTEFDIEANAGYFLSNRLAVDTSLGFNYSKWTGADAKGESSYTFGAAVRYYPFGNFFARAGYFGETYIVRHAADGQTSTDKKLASWFRSSVGYDWFISEKVFFEPAIFFNKQLEKGGTANLGLSLGVGIKF